MKLAVAREQIRQLRKEGATQLSELFSKKEMDVIKSEIGRLVGPKLSYDEQFMQGFDLGRESEKLHVIFGHKKFAEVAAFLLECLEVRFAFDQLLPCFPGWVSTEEASSYSKYIASEQTLAERSSIQGMLGGFLIALDDRKEEFDSILPAVTGDVLFVSAEAPWMINEGARACHQRFLLLTYCKVKSQYILNEEDPHTHMLKNLGYTFGDTLHAPQHPVVFPR